MATSPSTNSQPGSLTANTCPLSISVVIPAYNAGRFIGAAIESALQQTLPPLEIIVIDDGSTDDTRELLRVYEGRIRYYFQLNQGIGAARNAGIGRANGNWIALLDADDVWAQRKLETQCAVATENPAVALIGTEEYQIDREGDRYAGEDSASPGLEADLVTFNWLLETAVFGPSSVIIRKTSIEAVGGFSTKVQGSEDMLMWWTLAAAFPVLKLRASLTSYRIHSQSMCSNYLTMIAGKKRALAIAVATLAPLRTQLRLRCLARARIYRDAGWERHRAGHDWRAIADVLISIVNHPVAMKSSSGSKRRWERAKQFCRYVLSAFCNFGKP